MNLLTPLRGSVQSILQHHKDYEWTVQGFGMLRTYLDDKKRWRLNIWTQQLSVPDVSIIHDHPWSFTSYILSGCLTNVKYSQVQLPRKPNYKYHVIETGEDGGPTTQPMIAELDATYTRAYYIGEAYYQQADEVHKTIASEGTVTLNDRSAPSALHTARVFWELDKEWVDAKPRLATPQEIKAVVELALENWGG